MYAVPFGSSRASDVVRHRHLLARRLGVEVDEHGNVLRNLGEDSVDRLERTVDGLHEDASLHVDDGELERRRGYKRPPAARAFGGEVRGPDDALKGANLPGKLLLPPGVVAKRDRIGARIENLLRERRGKARARRAVLGVHDDGGKQELAPEALELLRKNSPSGAADDVAYHQYLHCLDQ